MSDGRIIDTSAAAKALGVTPRTIQRWAEAGHLRGWQVAKRGQWRFDASAVLAKRDGSNKSATSDTSDATPVDR